MNFRGAGCYPITIFLHHTAWVMGLKASFADRIMVMMTRKNSGKGCAENSRCKGLKWLTAKKKNKIKKLEGKKKWRRLYFSIQSIVLTLTFITFFLLFAHRRSSKGRDKPAYKRVLWFAVLTKCYYFDQFQKDGVGVARSKCRREGICTQICGGEI